MVAADIAKAFDDTTMRLTAGGKSVDVGLGALGAEPQVASVVTDLTAYPFWQRYVPLSILWPRFVDATTLTYANAISQPECQLRAAELSYDAVNASVQLKDGQTLTYDAALIATGGTPNALDVPGADLPQVFLLRTKDQAQKILSAAKPGQRAVIIGDSFIAMESAAALREYGLDVTVLARHAVPFAKQFGETVGKAILARHVAHGVVFHTKGEAAQIEGSNKVEAVRLDNGQRWPADLVLVGIGVSPATGPFNDLPLEKDHSLKVDGGMVYNNTLMQFQADVLGVPVIRPKVAETTALGAAYAAGLAVGFWKSEEDIRENWAMDKTWEPDKNSKAATENYRMWKKAVTRTFDWVEH